MYGDLILLDAEDGSKGETLQRIPLGASVASGGMDESSLQDLLFRFPETLPISAIDAAYEDAVPVCRELSTPAGYVDALYVNPAGRLTLAEFKLWRNPQARREVIGQILDYAKELASWGYEDLQREVSRTVGRKGNVPFELIRERFPEANEAEFVDNVTRHLKRGEFLLMIVGDGIREGVENIVDFVQRHSGLRFNLALVEAALYRDGVGRLIVQPRVLARTEIVRRIVVEAGAAEDVEDGDDEPLSDPQRENLRFWTDVFDGFSFSDVSVEVPRPSIVSVVFVRVVDPGASGGGPAFCAFLDRTSSDIGCFLMRRRDIPATIRVFDDLDGTSDESSADFERWTARGSARLGFRRRVTFPLVADGRERADFVSAVSWMRDHLDRLVSTLHPRLRRALDARSS